jgi:hypothetical protein
LNNENAKFYVFLIYTPVLILVSWLLEMGVDTPAKNFSAEVDIAARIQRPRLRGAKNMVDDES